MLKALNGTQKASQSWCEHSANIVAGWEASRNDYSGAVFRLEDANIDIEQHGDDFFCEGPRLEILKLRDKFAGGFMVKKAVVISPMPTTKKRVGSSIVVLA